MEEKEKPKEEPKEDVKETLKDLMETLNSQAKDIEILKASADKRALALYYQRNKKDMPPIVSLRTIDVFSKETNKPETKLIVGWRVIEDLGSYQVPGTGKWTESQTIEVIFKDGTSQKMALMEFNRKYEKNIQAKVVGTITDNKTGKEALKLQRMDTGEELTISVEFVN